jgi:hypothetical protein
LKADSNKHFGATTFIPMTLQHKIHTVMTPGIMTIGITTLYMTTVSIVAQQNDTILSIMTQTTYDKLVVCDYDKPDI